MALKSITGRTKLVQIMNRFGHYVNYNALEELETATAEVIKEREKVCPGDTLPGLPIALAFENFDEMTQTLSGSNTLHDTMGLLYQNIPEVSDDTSSSSSSIPINSIDEDRCIITEGAKKVNKKKRSLTISNVPADPYFRVPKITVFCYKNTHVFSLPDVSLKARQLDLVWMISHALEIEVLPMWVGFNSRFTKTDYPNRRFGTCQT